jgi:response regulator NasT
MTKAHLLVVDDDRLILATLSSSLRTAGYQVTPADCGEEALRAAAALKPDLALLDMRMPGMSGIEVARELHDKVGTPFVFLSAFGDRDIVQPAVELGALGYLVKPLDVSQIVPTIETALLQASEVRRLHDAEGQLANALQSTREISMAIGLLMERRQVNRQRAFEILRDHSRSQQLKVAVVAESLLRAAELLNAADRR